MHTFNLIFVGAAFLIFALPMKIYAQSALDIIDAVVTGNMERLEWLISEGVDPDYFDAGGDRWTPLIHAVNKGNYDIADRLLRAHADPNQAEKDGWTGSHFAAALGHAIIARLLVEAGADISLKTISNKTPMDLAKEYGKYEVMEVFEMATLSAIPPSAAAAAYRLNHPLNGGAGANVGVAGVSTISVPSPAGRITVGESSVAASMPPRSATAIKHKNDVEAFFKAASDGPNQVFSRLIQEKRVDVNAKSDGDGRTALHRAAESNDLSRVRELIQHGAYVNEVDANLWTALMFAATKSRTDIVQYLLMEGADPFARNSHGISAYVLAAENGHPEISSMITSSGLRNALHLADEAHITQMLNAGADPDTVGPAGFTPLLHYASRGLYDKVQDVLRLGCDPNSAEKEGWTSLHFAAFRNDVQNVVLLMNSGANPTIKNSRGKTAMDLAVGEHHQAVVDILNSYKTRNLRSGPNKWTAGVL